MIMPSVIFLDPPVSLGKQVRILRIARGWRQTDLAGHAGVTPAAISLIERDLDYPQPVLARISRVLGIDLESHDAI